ncbi:hypothetical protein HK100_010666, partial [Physocladia obscura]
MLAKRQLSQDAQRTNGGGSRQRGNSSISLRQTAMMLGTNHSRSGSVTSVKSNYSSNSKAATMLPHVQRYSGTAADRAGGLKKQSASAKTATTAPAGNHSSKVGQLDWQKMKESEDDVDKRLEFLQ